MFDERRDARRGAAYDARDCVRTEQVARHEHRRSVPKEHHLGRAAAHHGDGAGLHAAKNVGDTVLAGGGHKPRDAIRDLHGDGIVCRAAVVIISGLAAQRAFGVRTPCQ